MALPGHTLPRAATAGVSGTSITDDLAAWASNYAGLHVDLGTGDGRFAIQLARAQPDLGVIGVDTILDGLRDSPRRLPANVRFVQRDAHDVWLGDGSVATSISVNFPYGSLLRGLVEGDAALLARLDALLGRDGRLAIRVNERALTGTGLDPAGAEDAIVRALEEVDALRVCSRSLTQAELRAFPSTWAKRLGYGRPTTAFLIEAVRRTP